VSPRVALGSWRCPSGNGCDVSLESDIDHPDVYHVRFAWDDPPPFSSARDLTHYLGVILPEVTRRTQESLERPGRALVVVGV
jgi:hypothetical protein